jgi:hypothetical protein
MIGYARFEGGMSWGPRVDRYGRILTRDAELILEAASGG